MNKYVIGTNKNPWSKQRRTVQMSPMERLQLKKRVTFKTTHNKDKKTLEEDIIAVQECRKMFRQEILVLGQEVVRFRETCEKEITRYKSKLHEELHMVKTEQTNLAGKKTEQTNMAGKKREQSNFAGKKTEQLKNGGIKADPTTSVEKWTEKLSSLQKDMDYLAKKQSQLDRESAMVDEEERISKRKTELEQYEKEVDDIEAGLDRRQEMCQKRQNDLLSLEEELDRMKLELEQKKDTLNSLGIDTNEASRRSKDNLELIRNNLLEKQSFLQKKIDQYRTDLATLKSTCTAKDITIQKLQSQVQEMQEDIDSKNTKIEQLNTQLSFVLEEVKANEERPKRSHSRSRFFSRQNSSRRQDSLGRQESESHEDRDKLSNLPDNFRRESVHNRTVKHPMRQSVDLSNSAFQMGIKAPSFSESRACIVM